jgi:hypothetical protein
MKKLRKIQFTKLDVLMVQEQKSGFLIFYGKAENISAFL